MVQGMTALSTVFGGENVFKKQKLPKEPRQPRSPKEPKLTKGGKRKAQATPIEMITEQIKIDE